MHDQAERKALPVVAAWFIGILIAGAFMLSQTGCKSSDTAPAGYNVDTYPSNSAHFIGQPQ